MATVDLDAVLREWLRRRVQEAGSQLAYSAKIGVSNPDVNAALNRKGKRRVTLGMFAKAVAAHGQPISIVLRELSQIAWELEMQQLPHRRK